MDNKTEKIEEKYLQQAQKLGRDCEILPGGVEELARKLQKSEKTGVPLKIKLGMDPSRPDLHLGHTVVMRKIREFQKLGHTLQLLVGGATAMIGDPSGKSDTRPALTKEQVYENSKTYFEQISRVVNVEAANVLNNADWLHKMNLQDILSLSSKVTVAQIMTRDDFSKRYSENKVNEKEMQNFAGALSCSPVRKGVFITTSYFDERARRKADDASKKGLIIRLIDGER